MKKQITLTRELDSVSNELVTRKSVSWFYEDDEKSIVEHKALVSAVRGGGGGGGGGGK
jgi:hypothetical protein